jgi:hypothetical protein
MYIFPAGGQRGQTVDVKVGGLFLHDRCGFEMLGQGITAPAELKRGSTLWLEGPLLPLPDSQRQEDYPSDMIGQVKIAADAPLGQRSWRTWTSQGVTPAKRFVVGDLPEIVEKEVEGAPVPVAVNLPVTINGRIFPHEDVDIWAVALKKGQSLTAVVEAARLGSPLDARLEVRDPQGRLLIENDDAYGADPALRFTAPVDGQYQVKIHDVNYKGSQAHVYRLTLTTDSYVERVFPLGGKRGTRGSFTLTGQGLPEVPQPIDLPAAAPASFPARVTVGGKLTNSFTLDVDDLPEVIKGKDTSPLTIPVMANGRIGKPGETDRWPFSARKGDIIDIELRAQRLGSLLTGVLTIEDDKGKVLTRAEAGAGPKADPSLRFTAPADGTFSVVVAEKFHMLGGADYAYRLRLGRPEAPDFRFRVNVDALTIARPGQVTLPVVADLLGGFREAITLTLEGLPADVTATGTTIAAGQNTANLILKTTAATKIRSFPLTIRGTAKVAGKDVSRTAALSTEPAIENVRVAVGLATPFKIVGVYEMGWAARGSVARRKYKIERNGFDGPLTVRLAERQARHLQGATGPTITVPAAANEFEYSVTLPPWMEIGRTCRVCVMGVGVLTDPDGSKHEVSFNSVNQNEQLVAVIETGYLDLTSELNSIRVEPGKSTGLPLKITRGKGMDGPIRVELALPAHVRGVVAPAVTIPADQSKGTLMIRFEGEKPGPFNAALIIRATLASKNGPVTAEVRIDAVLSSP